MYVYHGGQTLARSYWWPGASSSSPPVNVPEVTWDKTMLIYIR